MEEGRCRIGLDFGVLYQLGKQGLSNIQQLQMFVQGPLIGCLRQLEGGMISWWQP